MCVAVVASAASAAPAGAASVAIEERADGRAFVYTGDPGEFNDLVLSLQGGRFVIQEGSVGRRDTQPVRAEPPCERDGGPNESPGLIDAYCPPQGVDILIIEGGDGNDGLYLGMAPLDFPTRIDGGSGADRITGGSQRDVVRGGAGDDTLTGGTGRDALSGEAGDDTFEADDGIPDSISCGDGYDIVKADALDLTAEDCELVRVGPEPPGQLTVRVPPSQTSTGLGDHGLLSHVTCPGACSVRADLMLTGTSTAVAARAATRSRVLGSGRANRRRAGRLSVRTSIGPAAARRLRRTRRPRLHVRITVKLRGSSATIRRRVRVRAGG